MPFVAGNDIDAHCSKCGKDTLHTVIEVHSGVVQEVRCMDCRDKHPYKRPQSAPRPKKPAVKPTRKRGTRTSTPKELGPPREWQDRVLGCDPEEARPYGIRETFELNEIIMHKKFGLGVVTAIDEDGKIDVAFRESCKKLIHGRV